MFHYVKDARSVVIILFLDLKTDRIMLVIIKSTDDPEAHNQTVQFSEDKRVKKIRYILVDRRYKSILPCTYNEQTFTEVNDFLS